jgi:hypothetical protein
LLNRYTVNSRIVGSNPIPSASPPFAVVRTHPENPRKYSGFCAICVLTRSLSSANIRVLRIGMRMGKRRPRIWRGQSES